MGPAGLLQPPLLPRQHAPQEIFFQPHEARSSAIPPPHLLQQQQTRLAALPAPPSHAQTPNPLLLTSLRPRGLVLATHSEAQQLLPPPLQQKQERVLQARLPAQLCLHEATRIGDPQGRQGTQ